ncbi:sulfoxide reductase heme-binding subunit YedZ [Paracoccus aestuarii]|uniref:Protein-methionine-sulfoxide reductase heme-binding subunit MsrQ n=1 Tax=Paracoccus aestuarii TaxID=453842 RepID=A0A418ZXN8_9RHOB|nr:protein-methionine-sulfoxide reductase heme-binding subunit MsrQ [Paracoccus aestuarii]RJL05288.1 sulfoxide reductase heme-binding subunit YedZ [Paracoccus aestuarii]WCQ99130.1 sulfoxide reductase heme-binding subunit YedZ [Paracoccus aestuarii]
MVRAANDALRRLPVWAVWLAGTIPFALLVWDTVTNNLGVDPVQQIEHRLGQTALYFLVAGLAVTPLMRLTGLSLMRFRRAIGVICFAYALAHVLAWVVMDMALLWGQMGRDIVKRPYLLFGMLGFAILTILAVTSTNLSIRRMGGQAWRRLHKLVYPAAVLVAMHWLWATKVNEVQPILWASAIAILLALRVVVRRPLAYTRPARA